MQVRQLHVRAAEEMTGKKICNVCGKREQTRGGFISGDGACTSITRTCDECFRLSFEKAKALQQERLRHEL